MARFRSAMTPVEDMFVNLLAGLVIEELLAATAALIVPNIGDVSGL
jgi:hypothetical protein